MTLQLKLQGSAIVFAKDDVMIGGNRLALLADIEHVATIEPGRFARVPTPIAFVGDGRTIGIIDMHAGRLAHATGSHEEDVPAHGEYFLPQVGAETTVFVDVVNETGATIMIRPGMRIGIMTLINMGQDDVEEPIPAPEISSSCIAVSASYEPEHLDPDTPPAYSSKGGNGVVLRADIPEAISIPPGRNLAVPTGFIPALPRNFEGQIRAAGDVPEGIIVSQSLPAAGQPVTIFVHNTSEEPLIIEPGSQIAQYVFTPVAIAALDFRDPNHLRHVSNGTDGR